MQSFCKAIVASSRTPQASFFLFPATILPTIEDGSGLEQTWDRGSRARFLPLGGPSAYPRSLRKTAVIAMIFVSQTLFCTPIAYAEPAPHAAKSAAAHAIDRFAPLIAEASQRFNVPAQWIFAVLHVESWGDVRAWSPMGAMGLMQIMPGTYVALRIRYGLGANPYDPRDNILAGAAYLNEMRERYGVPGFLAAYNAGPRRYEEHLQSGRPLPAETERYVAMLAPVIEAAEVADKKFVVANLDRWLRSLLFAVRPDSKLVVGQSSLAAPATSKPTAHSVVDLTSLVPRQGDLFVRRISEFRPQ